jgi:hypothetical protein
LRSSEYSPFVFDLHAGPKGLKAHESNDRLKEFDASNDVFVSFAHDGGLYDVIDFYPKGTMNDRKAKGWKEKAHWGFLSELLVDGGPIPPLAKGVFRERKMLRPLKEDERP